MNWNLKSDTIPNKPDQICEGDLAVVELPVRVIFEWSDDIVTDWDEEGRPLEIESGYIMKVLPNQTVIYQDHKFKFLANTITEF